jgi:hypothetical protein
MGRMILNLIDYDGDKQQVSFETVDAALDGTDYQGWVTDVTDMQAAIAAITLGGIGPVSWQSYESGSVPNPPANQFAQTNIQWIVEYKNTVMGNTRTVRIGTADLSLATQLYNGAPSLNLSAGVGATFKTAFETLVEDGGDPVEVVAVYYRE